MDVGSKHHVALQTMTTTDTRNVQATVDQVKKCADAGADIVRITVQGKKEAEACMRIREQLFKDRCAFLPPLQRCRHLHLLQSKPGRCFKGLNSS